MWHIPLVRLSLLASLVALPAVANAQVTTQLVASGLASPVAFVPVPTTPAAHVIVQKDGRVRLLHNGAIDSVDFLDLSDAVLNSGEQGLLGLAFSPWYGTDGRVFVYFIDHSGHGVLARFTATSDPLHPDPATRFDMIWPGGAPFIEQPTSIHKGGNLGFGPDNCLYLGLGDGGPPDDPDHHAQDPGSLLGKMLRLNTNVGDDDPEGYDVPAGNPFAGQGDALDLIWTFGLRNPWRWSFDEPALGGSGALIIADVGQDGWEELNLQPGGIGGTNFGWRNREGAHDYLTDLAPFGDLTDPFLAYNHDTGGSIIGGFVYRGAGLGGYQGKYFFGDFVSSRVWAVTIGLDPDTQAAMAGAMEEIDAPGVGRMSSFGIDLSGEIYVVSYSGGAVYRLVPASAAPSDSGSPPSTVCLGPDPFSAIGGGTCLNGGWLPPGVAPPSVPTDPTADLDPAPAPSPSTCGSPDPFAAMGGGTCFNGGWLPPGVTPPTTSSPPEPGQPDPTPPPAPVPTPDSSTCSTPDPFSAMGGGVCINGGWIPAGTAPPPPSPPVPTDPPPTLPPSQPGCAGSDPFAGIPGLVGVCVNGGWIPVVY